MSSEIADFVKYAPSSCNTQPWRVVYEDYTLKIYRTTEIKSIMPKEKVPFYNSIDMGIFLYFIELALTHNKIPFHRILNPENRDCDLISIATYLLRKKG